MSGRANGPCIRTRLQEHHADARKRTKNTPWGDHMKHYHPDTPVDKTPIFKATILAIELRVTQRKIREAIEIRDRKPKLSKTKGWKLDWLIRTSRMSTSTSAYRHESINTRVNQFMHAPTVRHTRKNSHIHVNWNLIKLWERQSRSRDFLLELFMSNPQVLKGS